MKKTLSEVLHRPNISRINVKVGAINGTGFFYCGKGYNAFYSLNTKINQQIVNQNKRTIAMLEDRLTHLDENYEKRIANSIKNKKVRNVEKYLKDMAKEKEHMRVKIPQDIDKLKQFMDIHLLDRKVVEIRDGISPDEKPSKVIYVEGWEKGEFWTVKEYEHRRKKNDTYILLG